MCLMERPPRALAVPFGKRMMERGIKPEYECFEMGHLDTILKMAKKGEAPGAPMQFNFVLGVPATVECYYIVSIIAVLMSEFLIFYWSEIGTHCAFQCTLLVYYLTSTLQRYNKASRFSKFLNTF